MQLKLSTESQVELFDKLNLFAAYVGKTNIELLSDLMINFFEYSYPNFTLVNEAKLVELALGQGLIITRPSLAKYRRMGVLEDEFGPWWFTNSTGIIVYHYEKVIQYLHYRKSNRYRRLKYDRQSDAGQSGD